MGAKLTASGPFYVADLRPEWRGRPCITFWRPNSAGYAYPLAWSCRYSAHELKPGYHDKHEGSSIIRFAVACAVVDALGVLPPKGLIDNDAGPVVMNTPTNRQKLRAARVRLPAALRNLGASNG